MSFQVAISEYWISLKFDDTPKAFANPSPGLERSDNPGEQT